MTKLLLLAMVPALMVGQVTSTAIRLIELNPPPEGPVVQIFRTVEEADIADSGPLDGTPLCSVRREDTTVTYDAVTGDRLSTETVDVPDSVTIQVLEPDEPEPEPATGPWIASFWLLVEDLGVDTPIQRAFETREEFQAGLSRVWNGAAKCPQPYGGKVFVTSAPPEGGLPRAEFVIADVRVQTR